MADLGSIIGGVGTLAAGGASIASSLQGKEAAERAARLQQQQLGITSGLGSQSTALGLAQLDLQRQLADRQISFANQMLAETQPFRDSTLALHGAPPPGFVGIEGGGGRPGAPTRGGLNGVVDPRIAHFSSDLQRALMADPTLAANYGFSNLAAPTSGAADGTALPDRTFTPVRFGVTPGERDTVEAQFRNAREATIANSPVRGGALASQLMDLQRGRAGAVVGLESDVARRNQGLDNAAALTNFQTTLDADRFRATDAINQRNVLQADAITQRNMLQQMAAQIGFNAPSQALPAIAGAQQAFNPGAAGQVFGPALQASMGATNTFGQNVQSGNQLAGSGGQALGSMAAAGKLANMKGGKGGGARASSPSPFAFGSP